MNHEFTHLRIRQMELFDRLARRFEAWQAEKRKVFADMKIVEPSAELLSITPYPLRLIEKAGRVCYKSEDRITEDSAADFCRMLIRKGHESVLEHAHATIKFVTDRGVSHELVRHRLASYSQESTRYCNYTDGKFEGGLTFINSHFAPGDCNEMVADTWKATLRACEVAYISLVKDCGLSPQEARCVLPMALKTEIVMTANFREWRTVFRQRLDKKAHPDMRHIMKLAYRLLCIEAPAAFEDLYPELASEALQCG